jgi:hypothetical protein
MQQVEATATVASTSQPPAPITSDNTPTAGATETPSATAASTEAPEASGRPATDRTPVLTAKQEPRRGALFNQSTAASEPFWPAGASSCNIPVCSQFYHSFRASDCTYQPYDGGPRRVCER